MGKQTQDSLFQVTTKRFSEFDKSIQKIARADPSTWRSWRSGTKVKSALVIEKPNYPPVSIPFINAMEVPDRLVTLLPANGPLAEALPAFLACILQDSLLSYDIEQRPELFFPLTIVAPKAKTVEPPPWSTEKKSVTGWYNHITRMICVAGLYEHRVKTLSHELGHWADTAKMLGIVDKAVKVIEARAENISNKLIRSLKCSTQ
jgi:hypothetical protein